MTRPDLLLRGGTVVDGTGLPPFRGDVAVSGDRICAVGPDLDLDAHQEIDVAGRCVAPGFIDVHTHDDNALLEDPAMTAKVSQGVTSVVVGNCGLSLAPLHAAASRPPMDVLAPADRYCFPRFADYVDAITGAPAAVNAAMLVGHSTLRLEVMSSLDRPATRRETTAMGRLVAEAMEAGAVGLSTGLYYPTARAASTEEVIALARIVGRHGGVYTTHLRDEGDHIDEAVDEALRIGRAADVPVVLSHHKCIGRRNFGRTRQTLPLIALAMTRQSVSLDVYPYTAASTMLSTELAELADRTTVTRSGPHPELAGLDLEEAARRLGCTPREAVGHLLPAGGIYEVMDEEDVRRVLCFPETMVGSDGLPSDPHPHPRLWGTFTRVLGHYVREQGLLTLQDAVRRMTGISAARFGLTQRGVITPGAYADIVVFDSGKVGDTNDYSRPIRPSRGIELVTVNGTIVWQDGEHSGQRPGRVLRRAAAV